MLVTSGTVTSAKVAEERLPGRRHPPIHPARRAALRRLAFCRSLAARSWRFRRIRSVAEPDHVAARKARIPLVLINGRMSEQSFKRWRSLQAHRRPLLGKFDVCLAQSALDAERFSAARRAGRAASPAISSSTCRRRRPTRRSSTEMQQAIGDRQVLVAASTHPGEEGGDHRSASAHPQDAAAAAHHHRAAPSGTRHGNPAAGGGSRLRAACCARAGVTPDFGPTSMSPTRSANSACSTGSRMSCSWAARSSNMADRIRSRRPSSRGRSCTVRMSGISPISTPHSMPRAAPRRWRISAILRCGSPILLQDPAKPQGDRRSGLPHRRKARRRARPHRLRTRALSPAIASGAPVASGVQCVSRTFWWRDPGSLARLLSPLSLALWRGRRAGA